MPNIDIPYEALDAIVIGALKDNIEVLNKNQQELQEIVDAGDELMNHQKIDYFNNLDLIKAMNKIIAYYSGPE